MSLELKHSNLLAITPNFSKTTKNFIIQMLSFN